MAKKTKKKPKRNSLNTQRNKVRGLIGELKSPIKFYQPHKKQGDHIRTALEKQEAYQRGIAATLITARSEIATSQHGEFLSWIEQQTTTQHSDVANTPANSELVNASLNRAPLPLDKEIVWVATFLSNHVELLSDFRSSVRKIEAFYWTNVDWIILEEELSKHEIVFGKNLWILETNILMHQTFLGTDARKEIVEKAKKAAPKSLSSYVAHYLSIRNDPSTILNRFIPDVSDRIENLPSLETLKNYLRFKLLSSFPAKTKSLAEILQVAQGMSAVDLYETLIAILQHLISTNRESKLHGAILIALEKLKGVNDFRLDKLRLALGIPVLNELPQKSYNGLIQSLSGHDFSAVKNSLKEIMGNPTNYHSALIAASHLKNVDKTKNVGFSGRWGNVIRNFAEMLNFDDRYDAAVHDFEKEMRNLGIFPSAIACLNAGKRELFFSDSIDNSNSYMAFLNGEFLEPEDLMVLNQSSLKDLETKLEFMDILIRDIFLPLAKRMPLEKPLDTSAMLHKVLIDSFQRGDVEQLTDIFDKSAVKEMPRSIYVIVVLTTLASWIDAGRRERVVQEISNAFLRSKMPLTVLPLEPALGKIRWSNIKLLKDKLCLSIALHLCWTKTGSESVLSNLRFAYQEFIDSQNITSATQLDWNSGKFDQEELIYFLRNVCVPAVIDMSKFVTGSREAEQERQNICSFLCNVDPERKSVYETEISGILHDLAVRDGIKIVDGSRVHVDTEAIRIWAKREWDPSFVRYQSLVASGIGVAEKFDVVLRDLVKAQKPSKNYLEIPGTEADQLLIDLILALKSKFLLDPAHGLDSYLSRRVRHHSMSGSIRGSVEEAHLITTRNHLTGKYSRNDFWLSKIQNLTLSESLAVSKAMAHFSEEFDKILLSLKQETFHINTPEHPKGIFEIPFPPSAFHLTRSAIQAELSIDAFCQVCFTIFWAALDPSLRKAQTVLKNDVINSVAASFQRLKSSLRRALGDRRRYADLSLAIAQTSERVQREVGQISDWFSRSEAEQSSLVYSFEKIIDIAVTSALNSQRPFSPIINVKVDSNTDAKSAVLVIISEIILTALGNVKQYSSIQNPKVEISIRCMIEEEIVKLRIESETGIDKPTTKVLNRVNEIRSQIEDGSYIERVREEGGTGLMKIANLVYQSERGILSFDFLENGHFFIEMDLSFISILNPLVGNEK